MLQVLNQVQPHSDTADIVATGVCVIGVQPGFPADVAGLSRGDIITKVNQQPVDSLGRIKGVHAAFEARPAPVLVEAQRNHQVTLYVLKP